MLGPVGVSDGSASLALGGPKQRVVLAALIAHAENPVTADALARAVYGEDAPGRSRRSIQTYVSTLRSVVGGAETLQVIKRLEPPHELGVFSFAFDSRGASLATGGADGFLRVWDICGASPQPTARKVGASIIRPCQDPVLRPDALSAPESRGSRTVPSSCRSSPYCWRACTATGSANPLSRRRPAESKPWRGEPSTVALSTRTSPGRA